MFLNNYHYILSNYALALQHQDLLHHLLEYYLFHIIIIFYLRLINVALFLNITRLFLSSACHAPALSPAPVAIILP